MENEEQKTVTLDDLATMVAKGFADVEQRIDTAVGGLRDELKGEMNVRFADVNKRIAGLSYRVDQLDTKVEAHRQETKDGFDAMRRVAGGMVRTLTDHEERIKTLEGE